MPEHIAIGCNIVAGLLVVVAFLVYNLSNEKINTGTWIILAFGDSLDLASYFEMSETWWKSIVPAAFALGSIVTFLVALVRRRFSWPDRFDWLIIVLDLGIIAAWSGFEMTMTTPSLGSHEFAPPAAANLALQATAVLGFIPMYRGLLAGKEWEPAKPWVLWTLAFVLFGATSVMTYETIEEIAYPLIGIVTHGLVMAFALMATRPSRP